MACERCEAEAEVKVKAEAEAEAEAKEVSYLPAWEAKAWETAKSSWKTPPAYGAYDVAAFYPGWSADLHGLGLTLPPHLLGTIFYHGLYRFYVHMILLHDFPNPFLFHVSPGGDATTYYPSDNKKARKRYEAFVQDALDFLEPYYQEWIEPLGIMYERWKIVAEHAATAEVVFLKDSIQTLIRTMMEALIAQYFTVVRGRNIRGDPPPPSAVDARMAEFSLADALGLAAPKKKAMHAFLSSHKRFLQRPFRENNLAGPHYEEFEEELRPGLEKIMFLDNDN
jgi:hypothetical protein